MILILFGLSQRKLFRMRINAFQMPLDEIFAFSYAFCFFLCFRQIFFAF